MVEPAQEIGKQRYFFPPPGWVRVDNEKEDREGPRKKKTRELCLNIICSLYSVALFFISSRATHGV